MKRGWARLGALLAAPALLTGCAIAGDEAAGEEAREAQIDGGYRNYVIYSMWQSGSLIGKVLVTGSVAGGGYAADREYWHLTQNVAQGTALTFTGGSSEWWSTPPTGLGTLSFVTERRPAWVLGTPSGTMHIESNPLTNERIAVDWGMTLSHGAWIGSITWWHSNTGNVFGPGTTHTLSPSTPSAGTWYSFTTSPL